MIIIRTSVLIIVMMGQLLDDVGLIIIRLWLSSADEILMIDDHHHDIRPILGSNVLMVGSQAYTRITSFCRESCLCQDCQARFQRPCIGVLVSAAGGVKDNSPMVASGPSR